MVHGFSPRTASPVIMGNQSPYTMIRLATPQNCGLDLVSCLLWPDWTLSCSILMAHLLDKYDQQFRPIAFISHNFSSCNANLSPSMALIGGRSGKIWCIARLMASPAPDIWRTLAVAQWKAISLGSRSGTSYCTLVKSLLILITIVNICNRMVPENDGVTVLVCRNESQAKHFNVVCIWERCLFTHLLCQAVAGETHLGLVDGHCRCQSNTKLLQMQFK